MKTIELRNDKAAKTVKEPAEINHETIVLTLGSRPVAALLPMAEQIAHLAKFAQLIEAEETVTLTVGGNAVAILQPLVPMVLIDDEQADLESVALSTHPQFLELIERSRQRQQQEGSISSQEMRRRLGI